MISENMTRRWLYFGGYLIVTLVVFWRPVLALCRFALQDDNQSQVILIPVIAAWLLVTERKRIFRSVEFGFLPGAIFIVAGAGLYGLAQAFLPHLSPNDRLTVSTLAIILLWVAGFAFMFGWKSVCAAQFPLGFLLLTVPLPDFLLNRVVYWLQRGSAVVTAGLFHLTGVPVLQDGFLFYLPRVTIEIATECSGIRSSLALLVVALLAGHLFLRTSWKKIALVIVGIALMLVKNGIRIVTLTLLASYVDPSFLTGKLHGEGGGLFFVLALLLLLPFLLWLRRSDVPPVAALRPS